MPHSTGTTIEVEHLDLDRVLHDPMHICFEEVEYVLEWDGAVNQLSTFFTWEDGRSIVHGLPTVLDAHSFLTASLVEVREAALVHTMLGQIAHHNPARHHLILAPVTTQIKNPLFEPRNEYGWGSAITSVNAQKVVPQWVQTLAGLGWFAPDADPTAPYTPYLRPVIMLRDGRRLSEATGVVVDWEVRQVTVDNGEEFGSNLTRFAWNDDDAFTSALATLAYDPDSAASLRALANPETMVEHAQLMTFWQKYKAAWDLAKARHTRIKINAVRDTIMRSKYRAIHAIAGLYDIVTVDPIGLGGEDDIVHSVTLPATLSRRNIAIPLRLHQRRQDTNEMRQQHYEQIVPVIAPPLQTDCAATLVRSRTKRSHWAYYVVSSPTVFAKSLPFLDGYNTPGTISNNPNFEDDYTMEEFSVSDGTWKPIPPHTHRRSAS